MGTTHRKDTQTLVMLPNKLEHYHAPVLIRKDRKKEIMVWFKIHPFTT